MGEKKQTLRRITSPGTKHHPFLCNKKAKSAVGAKGRRKVGTKTREEKKKKNKDNCTLNTQKREKGAGPNPKFEDQPI